jgi:hypothetical protein
VMDVPGGCAMEIDIRYRCFVCGRTGMTRREADEHWGDEFEGIYVGGRPIGEMLNTNLPSAQAFRVAVP